MSGDPMCYIGQSRLLPRVIPSMDVYEYQNQRCIHVCASSHYCSFTGALSAHLHTTLYRIEHVVINEL